MNRTIRNLAIMGACTAFATVTVALAQAAGAATAPPRCRTGQVSVALAHPVASGGNEGVTIRLRNHGAACTVRGYPRLGLELHGQPAKSITERGATYFASDPGPSVVTLEPGAVAKAHLSFGTVSGTGDVRASALAVRIRGAALHRTARLPGAPVTITNGRLAVTAWAAAGKG